MVQHRFKRQSNPQGKYRVSNTAEIRLNKFLAERLGISRREADEAINTGKVTVDGEEASLGQRIPIDKNSNVC